MPESQARDSGGSDAGKRVRLLEDILIILCLLPLWPAILGWRHPVFEYIMYAALVGLVVIFFRRIRRFRRVRDELQD